MKYPHRLGQPVLLVIVAVLMPIAINLGVILSQSLVKAYLRHYILYSVAIAALLLVSLAVAIWLSKERSSSLSGWFPAESERHYEYDHVEKESYETRHAQRKHEEALENNRRYREERRQYGPAAESGCGEVIGCGYCLLPIGALLLLVTFFKISATLIQYDFVMSLLVVLLVLSGSLLPKNLSKQTWRKLGDNWLKWSGVSALAVGGFGFIGLDESRKAKLLKIALDRSQVGADALLLVYLGVLVLLGGAALFRMTGASAADNQDSHDPLVWFAPAFTCAWLGNLGSFTLFFDAVVLTWVAHRSS